MLSLIIREVASKDTSSHAISKTPAPDGVEPTITWYFGGKRTVHGPDQQDDLERCLDEGTLHEKAIRVFLSPNGASAKGVRELLPKMLPRLAFDEAVVVSLPEQDNDCFPALVKKYPQDLKKDYPTPKDNSKFKPNRKGEEDESTWTPSCWQIVTLDDGEPRDSEPVYIQRPDEYFFQLELAAGLPDEEEDLSSDDDEDKDEGGAEMDIEGANDEDADEGAEMDIEAMKEEEDEDRRMLRCAGAPNDILDLSNNIDLLTGVVEIEVGIDDDNDDDHPWQGRKIYFSPTGEMNVYAEATRALPNHQGSSFDLCHFTYLPETGKWRNNLQANTPTNTRVPRADRLKAAENRMNECNNTANESAERLAKAETRLKEAATALEKFKRAEKEHKLATAKHNAVKAEHVRNMDALSSAEQEYKKVRIQ